MRKSNLDVAFEIVSKRDSAISFNDLWDEIKNIQGIEDDAEGNHIAKFYTALSLDGRFITIGDNKWDLRTRYTFDKVHIDMNDVYVDEDTDEVIEVSDDASEKELFDDKDEDDDEGDEDVDDEEDDEGEDEE